MNPTAFSYIRWSSAPQGKGHTEERQTDIAEEYAKAKGLVLDTTRNMRDAGVSGWSGRNISDGALGAFIKAIEAGDIAPGSFLLIEDIDRLSRLPVMDALAVFQRIIGAGITIVTLRDKQEYSLERLKEDWTPLMPILFAMARGHGESERKSDLIGKAWRNKKLAAASEARTPIGDNAPMWLSYSPDKGYTLKEKWTPIIERMFQLYIDGHGLIAISHILNDEGVRTSRGGIWGPSSLDRVLNNRSVIGEYQPRTRKGKVRENAGNPIPRYYPPAIDEETFYRAQRVRESRNRTGTSKQSKNFNLFQGIGQCRLCGSTLHSVSKGAPPKNHTYLRCSSAKKRVCKAGYIRLDAAEAVFREVLAKIESAKSLVHDASAELVRQQSELRGRIDEHRQHLKQLVEVLQTNTSSTILGEVVRRETAITDLTKQVDEISLALASNAITDKESFFASLDLVSYEGRNRANALLKELHITIRVATEKPHRYHVYQDEEPLFDLVKRADKEKPVFYPANNKQRAIIMRQEGTFTPLINFDEDAFDGDAEGEQYENEGYDSREWY
ncbi:recombinase family protein [Massilia litorea]|uniref:Recombinase family protein n=1 Tax=Massilia litorea TaxID=2769491 RepID=A0A7L9TZJ8_9BURK|nr:recombinase family protein [Massilia litorea]QOL48037.1 recombinase family protein [Massilia litorea]